MHDRLKEKQVDVTLTEQGKKAAPSKMVMESKEVRDRSTLKMFDSYKNRKKATTQE